MPLPRWAGPDLAQRRRGRGIRRAPPRKLPNREVLLRSSTRAGELPCREGPKIEPKASPDHEGCKQQGEQRAHTAVLEMVSRPHGGVVVAVGRRRMVVGGLAFAMVVRNRVVHVVEQQAGALETDMPNPAAPGEGEQNDEHDPAERHRRTRRAKARAEQVLIPLAPRPRAKPRPPENGNNQRIRVPKIPAASTIAGMVSLDFQR